MLPSRASRRAVGIGQTLLRVLLCWGQQLGGVWLEVKGKMVLCISGTDLPMMLVRLALLPKHPYLVKYFILN
jgi:hypothetical protein